MFIRGSHVSFVRGRPRGRRAAALVRMPRSDTRSAFCVLVPAAACRFIRHGLRLSPPRDLSLGLSLGSEGSRALLLTGWKMPSAATGTRTPSRNASTECWLVTLDFKWQALRSQVRRPHRRSLQVHGRSALTALSRCFVTAVTVVPCARRGSSLCSPAERHSRSPFLSTSGLASLLCSFRST